VLRWNRDKDRDKAPLPASEEAGAKGLFRTQARTVRPADEQRPVRDEAAPPALTLEDVLVSEGTVTADQLRAAQEIQAKDGGFLGQILINLGHIDANSLTSFLAKHCKIPHLSLLDYLIDEEQVKLVPEELCLKYRLLPIDRLGKNLTVAMVNPLDTQALEEVRRICPDLRVKPILCEYSHFQSVAGRLFKQAQQATKEMSMSSLGLTVRAGDAENKEAPAPKPAPVAPQEGPDPPPAPAEPAATAPAAHPQTAQSSAPAATAPAAKAKPADAPPATAPKRAEPPPAPEPQQPVEPPPAPEPQKSVKPPPAPEPPKDEPSFDDEAVLEAFFGMDSTADEDVGERSGAVGASSVLQEMVAIMGDSMRDTYGMLARKLELFHGLSSEQVAKVFAKCTTAEYEEGQLVFAEGDTGDDVFIVLGGSVAISEGGSDLATLAAGDAFGEMALLGRHPRTVTARVLETSSFLVLNETTVRRVLDKETALQLLTNLVVSLSRRLRQAHAGR
jgi:hypothetical protein